jgi:hypothetical protein
VSGAEEPREKLTTTAIEAVAVGNVEFRLTRRRAPHEL